MENFRQCVNNISVQQRPGRMMKTKKNIPKNNKKIAKIWNESTNEWDKTKTKTKTRWRIFEPISKGSKNSECVPE